MVMEYFVFLLLFLEEDTWSSSPLLICKFVKIDEVEYRHD